MQVYLIRHGLSEDDENGISQRRETALSNSGKKRLVVIRPKYLSIPFDQIYHSPWRRAKETAGLLFGKTTIPMQEVTYLHEYARPLRLEGVDPGIVAKFWDDNREHIHKPEWRPEDGESFNDIIARAKKLKGLLLKHGREETIGVVSHGTFLRHVIGHWLLGENYAPKIYGELLRHIHLGNLGYILIDVDKDKETIAVRRWHNW